jgi:hypothetical protein
MQRLAAWMSAVCCMRLHGYHAAVCCMGLHAVISCQRHLTVEI